MWYGDRRVYGARMGQEVAEEKHRQYRDYKRAEAARDVLIRAATERPVEQGSRVRTLNMMRARWRALQTTTVPNFPAQVRRGKAVRDPLAAGYWRYTSADGYAAADYGGATGTAAHTFVAEDGKMDGREETAADMDDVDK